MKIGVIGRVRSEDPRNADATLGRLARAESQGFDAAWIAADDPGAQSAGRSLFAAASLAERTEHIRVGLWSVLPAALHPLRLAEDLAVLDIVSAGRFDWAPTGPGLDEPLEIVSRAWLGEPFAHSGERFEFPELVCHPMPEQRPHPMVWLPEGEPPSAVHWDSDRLGQLLAPAAVPRVAPAPGQRALVYRLETGPGPRPEQWLDGIVQLGARHAASLLLVWPGGDRVSESRADILQDEFARVCLN